jgi:ABC-type polysaccharide/polyol phosphate export permease
LFLLILLVSLSLVYTWKKLNITFLGINIADFAQMLDASFSFLVLLGSGAYFLISYESRARKKKLIQAINKLIGLAHVVESHQLSKDPDNNPYKDAKMLAKYLNYCTDLLALSSKIGFLYVQALNDPEAQSIESELETLTSGISRKIWQKIMLVQR